MASDFFKTVLNFEKGKRKDTCVIFARFLLEVH